MRANRKKVPRIGDVIEIDTARGRAYAQYTHEHPQYGSLLRVLPGFSTVRPQSFMELVEKREKFFVFFPLRAAVRQGLVTRVAGERIPEWAQEFPKMRARGGVTKDGRVLNWWIFDGRREWRVDRLTEEQRSLPIRSIWTYPLLVERLEEEWVPEQTV
jgi:hypothetical protein